MRNMMKYFLKLKNKESLSLGLAIIALIISSPFLVQNFDQIRLLNRVHSQSSYSFDDVVRFEQKELVQAGDILTNAREIKEGMKNDIVSGDPFYYIDLSSYNQNETYTWRFISLPIERTQLVYKYSPLFYDNQDNTSNISIIPGLFNPFPQNFNNSVTYDSNSSEYVLQMNFTYNIEGYPKKQNITIVQNLIFNYINVNSELLHKITYSNYRSDIDFYIILPEELFFLTFSEMMIKMAGFYLFSYSSNSLTALNFQLIKNSISNPNLIFKSDLILSYPPNLDLFHTVFLYNLPLYREKVIPLICIEIILFFFAYIYIKKIIRKFIETNRQSFENYIYLGGGIFKSEKFELKLIFFPLLEYALFIFFLFVPRIFNLLPFSTQIWIQALVSLFPYLIFLVITELGFFIFIFIKILRKNSIFIQFFPMRSQNKLMQVKPRFNKFSKQIMKLILLFLLSLVFGYILYHQDNLIKNNDFSYNFLFGNILNFILPFGLIFTFSLFLYYLYDWKIFDLLCNLVMSIFRRIFSRSGLITTKFYPKIYKATWVSLIKNKKGILVFLFLGLISLSFNNIQSTTYKTQWDSYIKEDFRLKVIYPEENQRSFDQIILNVSNVSKTYYFYEIGLYSMELNHNFSYIFLPRSQFEYFSNYPQLYLCLLSHSDGIILNPNKLSNFGDISQMAFYNYTSSKFTKNYSIIPFSEDIDSIFSPLRAVSSIDGLLWGSDNIVNISYTSVYIHQFYKIRYSENQQLSDLHIIQEYNNIREKINEHGGVIKDFYFSSWEIENQPYYLDNDISSLYFFLSFLIFMNLINFTDNFNTNREFWNLSTTLQYWGYSKRQTLGDFLRLHFIFKLIFTISVILLSLTISFLLSNIITQNYLFIRSVHLLVSFHHLSIYLILLLILICLFPEFKWIKLGIKKR